MHRLLFWFLHSHTELWLNLCECAKNFFYSVCSFDYYRFYWEQMIFVHMHVDCWIIKKSINAKILHVDPKQYAKCSMEIKYDALHIFGLTRRKIRFDLSKNKLLVFLMWTWLVCFFCSSIILEKCMEFLTFMLW